MPKSIVGLDIGHGVLRAAEIVGPNKPRPQLVKYEEMTLPIESVSRGEILDREMVARALRLLWSRARFGTRDVVLGMGNQRVLARDFTVREAPLARIREGLPFQVQDLLPVPVNDALLDFYPISRRDSEQGPMVSGLLVAAIKDAVLANVEAVESAHLNVAEVDLIPFALTRLLLGSVADAGVVALVEIGASTTSVVIAVNGIPHFVRVLSSGSRDITDAVVARQGVSFEEAEALKRSIGVGADTADPDRFATIETLNAATGELLASIRNTIAYFTSQHPLFAVGHIALTGGGAAMPGLREAVGELIGLPVLDLDPLSRVAVHRSVGDDALRLVRDTAPVAIGLAFGSSAA